MFSAVHRYVHRFFCAHHVKKHRFSAFSKKTVAFIPEIVYNENDIIPRLIFRPNQGGNAVQTIQRYLRKAGKAISRFFKRVASGSAVDIAILVTALALIVVLVLTGIFTARENNRPVDVSLSGTESQDNDSEIDTLSDSQSSDLDDSPYADVILPKTEDGGQAYLDETLFVGDSNTYRLAEYKLTSWQNNLSAVGMGIQHITSTPCMYFEGRSKPVYLAEAVALMQPKRIIITFGTNNTSSSDTAFQQQYRSALDAIKKAWPHADIIINTIPPVAQTRSGSAEVQQAIDEFNLKLAELAQEDGYYLLNSCEALKNETTGFAKAEYMIEDGLHLNEKGARAWMTYVRMHTLITEDRRPALQPIPTHTKTPESVFNPNSKDNSGSDEKEQLVTVTFRIREGKEHGSLKGKLEQKVAFNKVCELVTAVPKDGYGLTWGCDHGRIPEIHNGQLKFTVPYEDIKTVDIWVDFHKHEFTEWKDNGSGTHVRTCSVCGKKEKGEHIAGNWESGKKHCTKCGIVLETKNPDSSSTAPSEPDTSKPDTSKPDTSKPESHTHTEDNGTTTDPTCTTEGVKVYKCTECGKEVRRETIPALGHKEDVVSETAPTCTAAGSRTHKCSRCGAERTESISALGHAWGETITRPDGSSYHTCTRPGCGVSENVSGPTPPSGGGEGGIPPEESNSGGGIPPEQGGDGSEPT